MSNNESFIDEVTEAVRRDRLFALFRRYGWIGITAIVLIVGWSAWNEWSKSRAEARAEAFGDGIIVALNAPDAAAREAALGALDAVTPEQKAMVAFLRSAGAGDAAGLSAVAGAAGLPEAWRDIAEFKRLTGATDLPVEERRAGFEALTSPGAPLRLLAEEQIALIDAQAGRTEDAIARLNALSGDTAATAALRRRAAQLIVALGGTPGG